MKFCFGHSNKERIEIDVLDYECPPGKEWVSVEIRASACGFRATVATSEMMGTFSRFLPQLRRLYDELKGVAEYKSLENKLNLTLTGNGRGHIGLVAEIRDGGALEHRLKLIFEFDQTELQTSIHELEKVLSHFLGNKNT